MPLRPANSERIQQAWRTRPAQPQQLPAQLPSVSMPIESRPEERRTMMRAFSFNKGRLSLTNARLCECSYGRDQFDDRIDCLGCLSGGFDRVIHSSYFLQGVLGRFLGYAQRS